MDNRRIWISCGISGMAGVICYILAITVPWPPGEAGLFDIGPFVGTYMLVIAVRFVALARRA